MGVISPLLSVLNEKRFNIYNNMNINIYILVIINRIHHNIRTS